MGRQINAFSVVIGIALIFWVGFWLTRLARFAREGEIHLVMSAAGDGLMGQVLRAERPILFWTIWSANIALMVGVLAAYIVLVMLD